MLPFTKKIIIIALLLIPEQLFSQELFNTFTNRITKISINFNTETPIKSPPLFLTPENSVIINQVLTSNFKGNYLNKLDLYCIFEKEGKYELGPFVFHDFLGNSVSINKVTVNVIGHEDITLKEVKTKPQDAPPKFYTIIPPKNFYIFTPAYLIIDVPSSTKELFIYWPGWKGVITDKIEERIKKDGRKEIIFSAIFTKAGKYNLAPLKIAIKNSSDKELVFSTSMLSFDVKEIDKENREKFFIGDLSIKLNSYSTTENNTVNIEVIITGTSFLEQITPLNIEVTPTTEVFLKEDRKEYFSKFPEYSGSNTLTYFFIPPSEGIYTIKIPPIKVFNPSVNSFINLSSITKTIKVHLPSNPVSKEKVDYEKNLNIRIRPDYDFYFFLGFFIFITILTLIFYLRTKKTITKKSVSPEISENYINLSSIQRSILKALENITKEELLTASPSKIKNAIDKIPISVELKKEIISWLNEAYKTLYIKKIDDDELVLQGLNLLKKIAKATEEIKTID